MKDGKFRIDFSTYWIVVLIAWKIQKYSDRIPIFALWIKCDRFCAITTMPIAQNKPIPIGSGIYPVPRRENGSWCCNDKTTICSV